MQRIAAAVAVMSACAGVAQAELVTYNIVPAQSTLTVTGSLTGNTASPQTTGSTTTSYSGTIVANRNPGLIEFPGGSLINAINLATQQQPDDDGFSGTDPANYGRTAPGPFGTTTFEAIRNLQLDVFDDTSGFGIVISGTNFNSSSLQFVVDDGESDTIFGLGGSPDLSLAGKNTGNSSANGASTVTVLGSVETLTLKFATGPIGYSVSQTADSSLSFTGQIVANRTVVPEPSAALMAIGAIAAVRLRRWRRTPQKDAELA